MLARLTFQRSFTVSLTRTTLAPPRVLFSAPCRSTFMSASPTAAVSSTSPPSFTLNWVRPMLRRVLPATVVIDRVRGDAIWSIVNRDEAAIAEMEAQMQELTVSSSSPTASPSTSSSSLEPTSASSTPTRAQQKQQQGKQKSGKKNGGSAVKADADSAVSPPPTAAASSSLILPAGHTLESTLDVLYLNVTNSTVPGYEFSSDCSSKERVIMHAAAESKGLEHESLGFRPRRHLYVCRPYEKEEKELFVVCRMGHIYLEGSSIDLVGSLSSPLVDAVARNYRQARDGVHYHVTLVHSGHVETLRTNRPKCLEGMTASSTKSSASSIVTAAASSSVSSPSSAAASASPSLSSSSASASLPTESRQIEEDLVSFFSTRLTTPFHEFGLGRATSGQNTAFFRVLFNQQFHDLRKELGLPPQDLHVTVGFKTQDIHNTRKDANTLCEFEQE